MNEFRQSSPASWLHPEGQRAVSARLRERLLKRCRGHDGRVITLTYRRDEYPNPLELYRRAAERQDVPMFLRRLKKEVGSLSGRWICKLEFQKGGWVHWHLIILDLGFVDHGKLTRLWRHGHVWVDRLTPRNISYCCKYLSKDGGLPAWLYAERPRAVKIVRTSPGFWGDTPEEEAEGEEEEEQDWRCSMRFGYRPIGATLGVRRVICRSGEHWATFQCGWGDVCPELYRRRIEISAGERGRWLSAACSWGVMLEVFGAAEAAAKRRQRRLLHSIRLRNPDFGSWVLSLGEWFGRWFTSEVECVDGRDEVRQAA